MAILRMPIEQHDALLRISSGPQGWLAISGEIDAWNVDAFRDAVHAANVDAEDVHLDLSRLLFCDVTGIRAMVATAASLGPGRRLVLHGLDPRLQKVFRVVGWAGMPTLVLDAGGVHHS